MQAKAVSGLLYVLAKEPVEGSVKTRLCPPLTAAQAVRCHRAFVTDTVAKAAGLPGLRVVLATSPGLGGPWLAALARRFGLDRVAQCEGELGVRMAAVMRAGLAVAPTLLVGADAPDLPAHYIMHAFELLSKQEVVIGPADDGGYYLIGASRLTPGLFDIDADWGGPQVLAATVARLEREGVGFALLPRWCDVDDYSDLVRLAVRVSRSEAARAGSAPAATARLLGELAAEGVAL